MTNLKITKEIYNKKAIKIFNKKAIKIFNKKAILYDKVINSVRSVNNLEKLIKKLINDTPINSKVLDLGSGTGFVIRVLLNKFPPESIIGFDFSQGMLKRQKNRFPEVKAVLGNYNDISEKFLSFPEKELFKFEQDSFDLIISLESVSENGDLGIVLPFIKKLLKKDGTFIAIGIKKHPGSMFFRKIWHYIIRNSKIFAQECQKVGFPFVETVTIPMNFFPLNLTRYIVVAKK